jgi:hypothetical protein
MSVAMMANTTILLLILFNPNIRKISGGKYELTDKLSANAGSFPERQRFNLNPAVDRLFQFSVMVPKGFLYHLAFTFLGEFVTGRIEQFLRHMAAS